MNKINVVNKRDHAPTDKDFYIGRGSVLGNPYTSKPLNNTKAEFQALDRTDAIEKYDDYLSTKLKDGDEDFIKVFDEMLKTLIKSDIYLVCYCKPNQCHGDVIKRILFGRYIKFLLK